MTSTSAHAGRPALAHVMAVVLIVLFLSTTAATASALPRTNPAADRAYFSYSSDGVSYAAAVPQLFADAPKLVPGEGFEKELWVRNDNATAFQISVGSQHSSQMWDKNEVRVASSSAISLEAGHVAPIQLQLWLPDGANNASQGRGWELQLRIHASETVPSGGTELGNTGGITGAWPLAILALLGGAAMLLGARNRNKPQTMSEETP